MSLRKFLDYLRTLRFVDEKRNEHIRFDVIVFSFFQGVTFLAFGNGAPDIFSAIAAVGSATGGDVGLAFGALFGR